MRELKSHDLEWPQAEDQRADGTGLGRILRRAREERGLSIAELEEITKIRGRYLVALEEERFDLLPPPVYVKGYLRTCAKILGLDVGTLFQAYAQASQPPPEQELASAVAGVPIRPARTPSRFRRSLLLASLLLFTLLLLMGYLTFMEVRQFQAPLPEQEVNIVQPQPSPPPPSSEVEQPQEAQPPANSQAQGVQVEVRASGRSWIRVLANGERVFEGFLLKGDARVWEATEDLVLRVGNAGAVAVSVNGAPFEPMGSPGEVVERTFTNSRP